VIRSDIESVLVLVHRDWCGVLPQKARCALSCFLLKVVCALTELPCFQSGLLLQLFNMDPFRFLAALGLDPPTSCFYLLAVRGNDAMRGYGCEVSVTLPSVDMTIPL
jgi:hypothetical protein